MILPAQQQLLSPQYCTVQSTLHGALRSTKYADEAHLAAMNSVMMGPACCNLKHSHIILQDTMQNLCLHAQVALHSVPGAPSEEITMHRSLHACSQLAAFSA